MNEATDLESLVSQMVEPAEAPQEEPQAEEPEAVEAEAAEVRNGIQEYMDATEQQIENSRVPLPNVPQSNFPVISQGGATPTGGSDPQLAQALNLFNKGGIVSAKKNF